VYTIHNSDCINQIQQFEENSIDAIVTDPPYELGFMGKKWDASGIAYNVDLWRECLRVLKPGGHLLAFGGTRTYHRMTCAIEDAGFEIRDCIQWIYGSGFPKSHNVSIGIDKAAGAEREVIGQVRQRGGKSAVSMNASNSDVELITAPATDEAIQWNGWGTALKPANEPIVMARKPFKGTIADNILQHGVGGLNIDASRIGDEVRETWGSGSENYKMSSPVPYNEQRRMIAGRWPANVMLDESAAAVLDEQSGTLTSGKAPNGLKRNTDKFRNSYGSFQGQDEPSASIYGDSGGASRFFYVAKPSKSERSAGIDTNTHPTVKPITLMEHLVKLVTPINGVILDPFMGSGTTGIAAVINDYRFIGIEQSAEYVEIAAARIKHHLTAAKNDMKRNQLGLEI
jgi:DNA modification methylase